jgi:hypothetical protein
MPSVAAIERNEIGENDPTQPLAEVHGLLLSKQLFLLGTC